MRRKPWTHLLLTCALGSLAACGGGGGGGGSGFGSTPPPPPPPGYIDVFPSITQSTDFAAIGIQANAFDVPASELVTNGFAVSFDAVSGAYVIDLPASNPARFFAQGEDNRIWHGYLESTNPFTFASVLKPTASNPDIKLSHTSFAEFFEYDYDDYAPTGFVAFGTATAPAAIPTTGSATYDALVAGLTLDGDARIGGDATLQFDFGAGTLSGHFEPVLMPYSGGSFALGQYAFVNTVFGVGSTNFSGEFSHANPLLTGAFNGLFTGPNAEELMARWTADFVNPATQASGEMFGIWVGKTGGP